MDWDVHHGNGTNAIFYADKSVVYFSTHQFPHYPGTGRADEVGESGAEGTKVNVPLPSGTGDEGYLMVYDEILKPIALEFKPDIVLVSAGQDPHKDDPLGGMRLTSAGFGAMAGVVKEIANACCQGRLAPVLEGGYNLDAQAEAIVAELRALQGSVPVIKRPRSQNRTENRRGQEDPERLLEMFRVISRSMFSAWKYRARKILKSIISLCRPAPGPHIYCVLCERPVRDACPGRGFSISAARRSSARYILARQLHHCPSTFDVRSGQGLRVGGQKSGEVLGLPDGWAHASPGL